MEWRTATISDIDSLQKCALSNAFFANNYGAVNTLLYQKKFRSQIAIEDGWIFEKFSSGGKTIFGFPHNIDGCKTELKLALEKLCENAAEAESPIVFENVTLEEKDALLQVFPAAEIAPMPESGDYIYLTSKLSSLEGKKLSRKRNHIHQFENKCPDFRFELLCMENLSAVREIEDKWLSENSEFARNDGTLSDLLIEREIIFFALENFEFFSKSCGMSGGILFASGIPVAFCVASLLSTSVTDIHFEKCLYSFGRDGGYAVINNAFAKTVRTEFINREEDLGIEGLRKAKLSYYPERVLEKFSVRIM